MSSPNQRGYGWIPSRPDYRDLRLAFPTVDSSVIPSRIDFRDPDPAAGRSFLPPVVDQGQLGSCTANMADGAFSYDLAKQYGAFDYRSSRLFVYYCERALEGTVDSDSGASIADAAKVLNKTGAPPEDDWPYDVSRFAEKPPQQAYDDGKIHAAVRYARVGQTASEVGQCLAAGTPVCIGFTVYSAFEGSDVASTGVLNLPQAGESNLGGHAVLVVGLIGGTALAAELGAKGLDTTKIDTAATYYIVRNSWGDGWGDAGYFYMHQHYLLDPNLAGDFWVIQSVTSPAPAPVPIPTPGPSPAPPDVASFPFADVDPWAESPHIWRRATVAARAYRAWRGKVQP